MLTLLARRSHLRPRVNLCPCAAVYNASAKRESDRISRRGRAQLARLEFLCDEGVLTVLVVDGFVKLGSCICIN